MPVKNHLAKLDPALANQLIRPPSTLSELSLKSHITDSNYYHLRSKGLYAAFGRKRPPNRGQKGLYAAFGRSQPAVGTPATNGAMVAACLALT